MTNLSLRTLVAAGLAAGAIALTAAPASAMNKKDLVNAIAKDAGTSRAIAAKMLDSFAKNTAAALANGNRVALAGFGSFSVSKLAGRTGRNPQTGNQDRGQENREVQGRGGAEQRCKLGVPAPGFPVVPAPLSLTDYAGGCRVGVCPVPL